MGRKSKHTKSKIVPVRDPANMRFSRAGEEQQSTNEYGPTQIRRLRDAAMRGLRDSQWGTELGRLYLERKISTPMYGAGKWWANMAAQYHAALGSPAPSPKTCRIEYTSNGITHGASEGRVKHERQIVREFREAHGILLAAGTAAEYYVRGLCENDEPVLGYHALEQVRRGLGWIAEWRTLTTNGKRT